MFRGLVLMGRFFCSGAMVTKQLQSAVFPGSVVGDLVLVRIGRISVTSLKVEVPFD